MASWLKKSRGEQTVYHTSEHPYVLTDKCAIVCGNNILYESPVKIDSYISFDIRKELVKRQSANCFNLKIFPYKIENNKINFIYNRSCYDRKGNKNYKISVCLIKEECLPRLGISGLEKIASSNSKSFLLIKSPTENPSVHDAESVVDEIVPYNSCWHSAFSSIADKISFSRSREKGWVQNIPQLDISLFGIKDSNEVDEIKKALIDLEIYDKVDMSVKRFA